jgi:hypothetical protein
MIAGDGTEKASIKIPDQLGAILRELAKEV